MPYVILGLLIAGPLSMYDLHKRFAAGISLFYSASFGSIQRALRQLVAEGRITVSDDTTSARGRKLYTITAAGEAAWRSWMRAPIDGGSDAETTVLAKVFLAGRLARDDRAAMLSEVRAHVDASAAALHSLDAELSRAEVPADAAEVFAYQRATLDYGIRSHALMRTWIDELSAGVREDAAP